MRASDRQQVLRSCVVNRLSGVNVRRVVEYLRSSAAPYLSCMFLGMLASEFVGYLAGPGPIFKGQPAAILIVLLTFCATFALWLILQPRTPVRGPLRLFLAGLGTLWLIHMVIAFVHEDLFNHTVWTFVPLLALLWLKPPSAREGWTALWALAWALAGVLVLTRTLEILGVLQVASVPAFVTDWERTRYWLPFAGHFGLIGRWPGPFGSNPETGIVGMFVIVIALAQWRRLSPVLIVIGSLTLLLTAGRGPEGALAVAIAVLLVFTRRGWLGSVPRWVRLAAALVVIVAAAAATIGSPAGLSGRDAIWSDFSALWRQSPWLGVGTSGIEAHLDLTRGFTHAHDMLLDELVRYGLITLVLLVIVLLLGALLAVVAAVRGYPGPLAVLSAYGVLSLTEGPNGWMQPSMVLFVFVTSVLIAGAWLSDRKGELIATGARDLHR